jgi:hypothetical protein
VAGKINAKLVLGEIGAMNSQPHTFKEYSEKYMAFNLVPHFVPQRKKS